MTYIRREMQVEVERCLEPQRAVVVFGARRVGKTVLLREIERNFAGKVLSLNGEDAQTVNLLRERSITNYRTLFAGVDLVTIDEAQELADAGKILKLIVDSVPGVRVLATGSSSFDLRNRVGEPLVGRATFFMLTPFSATELAAAATPFEETAKIDERLLYGAYPQTVTLQAAAEKRDFLRDMVSSYLLKDILEFESIRDSAKLRRLLQLIAWQVGSEVSADELARQLSMSKNTVLRYLDLLSKVFVIFRLGGYSSNLRKEVVKSAKWYFHDVGIRNAVINSFEPIGSRRDAGALWENYYIAERIKRNANTRGGREFYFWRTYDQQEIDLIEVDGGKLAAYELKSGRRAPAAPRAFATAYPAASFTVVNKTGFLATL